MDSGGKRKTDVEAGVSFNNFMIPLNILPLAPCFLVLCASGVQLSWSPHLWYFGEGEGHKDV